VLPDAAKEHSPAGALVFAGYYFKAFDWGVATTDPYLVQRISAPSCTACARYSNGLRTLRRQGGFVRGGRVSVDSARTVTGTFRMKSDYVVEVTCHEEAVVLVHPSSAPSTAQGAVKNDVSLVFVSWADYEWRIVEVAAPS
jgi:hypothetical protein